MKYEELPQELRSELEEKKICMVRRSSLVGDNHIDATVLLDSVTAANAMRLKDFQVGHVSDWFNEVATPYGDDSEKGVELVKNALLSVQK